MDALHWWRQGDAVTQGAAVVLLAMSVASWVVMLWKARLVLRAGGDVARCTAAVWQSPSLDVAAQRLAALDSQALVAPLVAAAQGVIQPAAASVGTTLAAAGPLSQQLTRVLRDALHGVLGRLQYGQGTIDRLSGPVGEALVMTAAGLAVAIPAVLAYNVFGRLIGRIEADLEGFALDLRELLAGTPPAQREGVEGRALRGPEGTSA